VDSSADITSEIDPLDGHEAESMAVNSHALTQRSIGNMAWRILRRTGEEKGWSAVQGPCCVVKLCF
jgi:hypothetical protein